MKTLTAFMYGLKTPKSHLQEVLLSLITKGKVSMYSTRYYGTSKRVGELARDNGIAVSRRMIERKNKYNETERYAEYTLQDKEKAVNLYKRLTSK